MQDASNPTARGTRPAVARDDDGAPEFGDPASVHVIVGSTRARVVLSGEIDADIGAELGEAVAHAEKSGLPVEIDAHHVTFMDSSGVAFLARLASRSPEKVRVLRAPPTVRFLLEVTRIGDLLEIVDDDPGFDE
ncbi:STAS domain-containing protein [Isoptericola variabilis]|uniref:Sulfate transporter/antisigma-factor antagonist STAS n=1 Tax=Isoptericola variabilis (strain 225) TaxID=743718 RepID=F6FSW9_ISOV2|nr:STAS domain-containing protein [Isoptericola variabilis]AEG43110.1 Sulfate transporter/antisigma-factor antagonist STAS [Isoptericola variabilis 225]TWH35038.1 anti-anti-sigma factor [Isoptericola variabilis J7]